jgi:hypothetical protein
MNCWVLLKSALGPRIHLMSQISPKDSVSAAVLPGYLPQPGEGQDLYLCISTPPLPSSSPDQLLESFFLIVLCDQICKLLSKLLVTF